MERENIGRREFREGILEAYRYLRYTTEPDQQTIDAWYEKCSFIPKVAFIWIIETLEGKDNLPRNVPKEIIRLWYEFQRQPGVGIKIVEPCEDCKGRGFLSFRKHEKNFDYTATYTARCGNCNNEYFGKDVRVATLTQAKIVNKGWEFLENEPTIDYDEIPF